jgi:putative NIF3 family GTP cyclohydrolase 1 type 2
MIIKNQVYMPESNHNHTRRQFIINTSLLAAGGVLLNSFDTQASPKKTWTVGEIMDLFVKDVKGAPFPNTVDTLKAGSRDMVVSGIVTTMFATIDVIRKAIEAKANFIIAHEPTFYNHLDETDWLKDNKVYQFKAAMLKDNKITVWRNHDYIHTHNPDGVMDGVIDRLQWKPYTKNIEDGLFEIPSMALKELIAHCKKSLGISNLRYIGDDGDVCSKVLLMPGAAGGRRQITNANYFNPDVLIVGEAPEWETIEYVRDARGAGTKLSLIVLGHADSEEPGSAYMASWIRKNVEGVNVLEIPAGNALKFS